MSSAATTANQNTFNNLTNAVQYAINGNLLKINTILPCKIIEIDLDENTATISPLVNTLTLSTTLQAQPEIYEVPIMQIVGGNAGIILEYMENDIVAVGFSQRDISVIKKNWTLQNPASLRKFSLMDAIILGKLSNSLPSIFVKITSEGITITAPDLPFTLNSNSATINAEMISLGNSATAGVLLETTQLQVENVQAGLDILPITIANNTQSQTVFAAQ